MGQVVAEARLHLGAGGGPGRRSRLAGVGTAGAGPGAGARRGPGPGAGAARVGAGITGAGLSPFFLRPVGGERGGMVQGTGNRRMSIYGLAPVYFITVVLLRPAPPVLPAVAGPVGSNPAPSVSPATTQTLLKTPGSLHTPLLSINHGLVKLF